MASIIKQRRQARGHGGFTLIELLVVILILGILAAVVALAVSGIGSRADTNACKVDLRNLKTAAEAYRTENNGDYATTEAALVTADVLDEVSANYDYSSTVAGPPTYTRVNTKCPAP